MLLSTAFLVGLLGSVHCLGMCAPITWAVPVSGKRWKWLRDRAFYNLGRVLTYGFLGLLVGFIGSGFSLAGWQQGLSVMAGSIMLLGVLFFGMEIPDKGLLKPLAKGVAWIKVKISPLIMKGGIKSQLTLGLLNGLLPCGLVYAALIAAWSMGSVQGSVAYMLLFGLGTFPMMLGAAVFGRVLGQRFRKGLWQLAPKLVAVVGILLILRGLNLGIPYVSPALTSDQDITECIGNEALSTDVLSLED